jgi:bidirectional [NiFe] hydrogenase diaphorase subunit
VCNSAVIQVDGQEVTVRKGSRLLPVLREMGIRVPSLCYHPALSPSAACKLCVVEVRKPDGHPRPRLSCAVRAVDGLAVTTESAMIVKMRSDAIANLLKMAPEAEAIHRIGREFGLTTGTVPDGCIRCRQCVRACSEIIGAKALRMDKRSGRPRVVPASPDSCIGCLTCVNLCPTGALSYEDKDGQRTIRIRDEVIGRHFLERCRMCGKQFATTRFLKHVHRREGDHPDEKATHVHCPTCAKLYHRSHLRITRPHLVKP